MWHDVVENYYTHALPLDGMWIDIDYMKYFRPFTYDEERFGLIAQGVKEMHSTGKHFVPIIEPGISYELN